MLSGRYTYYSAAFSVPFGPGGPEPVSSGKSDFWGDLAPVAPKYLAPGLEDFLGGEAGPIACLSNPFTGLARHILPILHPIILQDRFERRRRLCQKLDAN